MSDPFSNREQLESTFVLGVKFINSLVLTQGDTDYTVRVYRATHGYIAIWGCIVCGLDGQGTGALADPDSAVNACRLRIHKHQTLHHAA